MTVLSKPVALPRIALNSLWEWEGHGEQHPVLGSTGMWMSDQNKARLEQAVLGELAKQGMARDGHIAPEFRSALRVLAGATEEVYGWVADIAGGDTGAILVAAQGADAIRVLRDERAVVLDPISPDRLYEHFVEALPDVPAARISPISIPRSSYSPDSAPVEEDDFEFQMSSDYYAETNPADELAELMRAKRTAEHKVYVARRIGGRRVRGEQLTLLDLTDKGRVLTWLSKAGEEPMINCVPVGKDELVARLRAAADAL